MNKSRPIVEEIRAGLRAQGSELTETDVGRRMAYFQGFGVVLPLDVRKRVWLKAFGLVADLKNLDEEIHKFEWGWDD